MTMLRELPRMGFEEACGFCRGHHAGTRSYAWVKGTEPFRRPGTVHRAPGAVRKYLKYRIEGVGRDFFYPTKRAYRRGFGLVRAVFREFHPKGGFAAHEPHKML